MTASVTTCRCDDTLARAAQLMWDRDLGFLPVVDDRERLVGVITDRDALMAAYTRGTSLTDQVVATVMTRDPVTCTAGDEVTEVEHRMGKHQIRRLPVVDEQHRPVGVVTLSDVAHASLCGHEIAPKSSTWTLAAITMPRHAT